MIYPGGFTTSSLVAWSALRELYTIPNIQIWYTDINIDLLFGSPTTWEIPTGWTESGIGAFLDSWEQVDFWEDGIDTVGFHGLLHILMWFQVWKFSSTLAEPLLDWRISTRVSHGKQWSQVIVQPAVTQNYFLVSNLSKSQSYILVGLRMGSYPTYQISLWIIYIYIHQPRVLVGTRFLFTKLSIRIAARHLWICIAGAR